MNGLVIIVRILLMKIHKNLDSFFILSIGLFVLAWGALFIHWANAPGLIITFYRNSVASLVLLIFLFGMSKKKRIDVSVNKMCLAILAGMFYGVDVGLHAIGVNLSGATVPTVLANTAPIWVGLGAILFFNESLSIYFWSGLVVAMLGVLMLVGVDQLSNIVDSVDSFYGLMAAVFYAGFFLVGQKARESMDPFYFLCVAFASASITTGLIAMILGQPFTGYSMLTYIICFVYGAVIQVGGWLCVTQSLGKLPASTVSPILLLQAVITGVLAHLFLDEYLNTTQYMGGAMVLLGVFIVQRHRTNRQIDD